MADLTQTASAVRATATTRRQVVTLGENGSPGNWMYKASDGKHYKTLTTNSTTSKAVGMLLEYGEADGTGTLATGGDVDTGATGTVGSIAYVSENAGNMKETAPTSGQFTTSLGGHTTASNFKINIQSLGVAVP